MRSLFLVPLLLLGLSPQARAEAIHYLGPHPVDPALHRGMCHIEGPHLHAYRPHQAVLYVQSGIYWSFVGDPVEFESEAPRHAYYGHHPVFWVEAGAPAPAGEHYCYISGPHHHWYAPPPELAFKVKGGVHWYVGPPSRWYRKKWRRRSPIDVHYHGVAIVRPVVTVEPPEGFIGVYLGPGDVHVGGHVHGGAHVRGGMVVTPPRVEVRIPLPSVGISFGGGAAPPAYRVTHHGHGHPPAWGVHGGKGKGKWKKKGKGKWK